MNDEIFRGLIHTALATNENSFKEGEDLDEDLKDKDFTQEDFSPSAIAFLKSYVSSFVAAFPRFCKCPDPYRTYQWNPNEGTLWDYIGHDLWLNTCGHGSGFWDGDWEEVIGKKLSAWCDNQGDIEIYPGDDGLIYVSGKENYGETE